MKVRQIDIDLIQWMVSVLSESTVEMVFKGNAMERQFMHAGVPQGSIVSPILS